ncbi:type VII secretion protein EccE [Tsukamurella sp. PLM1]|uniref:type VII secretion protein EccE n=1 Tax=Tsukamurella sp. PLM1 TaxID=2929795 RepID=UPI002063EC24|nr:type VII secretion protein EccE [Tsukamurella sp. PLM1]BDH58933.1 hypothetical protein MTP03_38720 [Tsukamurella sp. PLM1]
MDRSTSSTGLVAPGRWHRAAWPATGAVLLAEAAAGAAALGIAGAGGPHWAAGAAALAVGGGALTRIRGASGAERAADRLALRTAAATRIEAAPYPGGGEIAVRRGPGGLTAMVRLTPSAPQLVALLRREDPAVPLELLAGLLRHADTPVAALEVLLRGGRVPGIPAAPRIRYQQLLGPLARWSAAEVLVAVTVDPEACAAACARRGSGPAGQARVAALAARRTVDLLQAEDIPAAPVRPADAALLDTAPPPGSVAVDADALARGELDQVLGPGTGTGRAGLVLRADGAHGIRLGAWRSGPAGAPRCRGEQDVTGDAGALAALHVPRSGYGQILGADAAGGPVGTRLHGPGVRTVWAAVADDPARQLVERAVATGARVLLITGRPATWEPLASWVGSPQCLWISGWRYPDALAGLGPGDYTVIVLDGTSSGLSPGAVEPSGTVWRIEAPGTSPVSEADVVLSQPLPGMLTVRTDGAAATLRLVA